MHHPPYEAFAASTGADPSAASARVSRSALRRGLRRARRRLDARAARTAALDLARILVAAPLTRGARRIALYLPADGEIDPRPAATALSERGAVLHLPRIDPLPGVHRLAFAVVDETTRVRPNRFGIDEPWRTPSVAPWTLDLVLLPLVGFDRAGGRLGMGGGFYDRTFDPARPRPARPLLVGVGHALQEVDALELAAHDVRLDAVATERELIRCSPRARRAQPEEIRA